MKTSGIDLSHIYEQRDKFTIIGLTGRTGSGCSTVAELISKGFSTKLYPNPLRINEKYISVPKDSHSFRKYNIIYNFFEKRDSIKYDVISFRHVITLFLLEKTFTELIKYLKGFFNDNEVENLVKHSVFNKLDKNFDQEIIEILNLKSAFASYKRRVKNINFLNIKDDNDSKAKLFTLYNDQKFKDFSDSLHDNFGNKNKLKHKIFIRQIVNNLRRSANPFSYDSNDPNNIFTISKRINSIIKSFRHCHGNNPTKIVIDSIRNPFEVLYFKQRYSAFYLMAINRKEKDRVDNLKKADFENYAALSHLLEEEYKGGKGSAFYSQYVRNCIEKADVHISYRDEKKVTELNTQLLQNQSNKNQDNNIEVDLTTPYWTWKMQLLKILALIDHPGLVTPSPEERSMQLAYTAKYNSGCISRQVGAAIVDGNYSLKAIGWNNTPEGQVPCLYRNVNDLIKIRSDISNSKPERQIEIIATNSRVFTPFEMKDELFGKELDNNFKAQIKTSKDNIKGRNVCFCFKTLHNSCYDGKNQVHTRSLHAEESAFLQLSKYGGQGIKGGKLFTTASPCELCAKKAYQLGIKVIYYIDPYPGISDAQILNVGKEKNRPQVRLFNGAIGNAYLWLYEPLMPYKDELTLILGQNIKDYASKGVDRISKLEKENNDLYLKNSELEKKIKELNKNKRK